MLEREGRLTRLALAQWSKIGFFTKAKVAHGCAVNEAKDVIPSHHRKQFNLLIGTTRYWSVSELSCTS